MSRTDLFNSAGEIGLSRASRKIPGQRFKAAQEGWGLDKTIAKAETDQSYIANKPLADSVNSMNGWQFSAAWSGFPGWYNGEPLTQFRPTLLGFLAVSVAHRFPQISTDNPTRMSRNKEVTLILTPHHQELATT